ncbi:MAG: DUF6398 domain-containing protein [Treponema sp.]|jgi:hypothetical protein|nr:DUF6398 domain-containing protein [Treponema sp.]
MKEEIKARETQLLAMIRIFCAQKLDDDYERLCEKVIKKLGRKRNVPFALGRLSIWAAAVVYAVGSNNFLFDKTFEPYVSPDDISAFFGTKKSSVANKARLIRDLLKMNPLSGEFSTRRMLDNNPLTACVLVDGILIPIFMLPVEIQELVKKARAEGKDITFTTE